MITKVGALHDPRSTAKLIVGVLFWFYGRKGFYSLMQFTRSIMATDLTRVEERWTGENWLALFQDDIEINTQGLTLASKEEIGKSAQDIPDTILTRAIPSELTGKPFRIIDRELLFHKRYSVALPTETPVERMVRRMHEAGIKRMTKETCALCKKSISSLYMARDGWKPYCTDCYTKTVV